MTGRGGGTKAIALSFQWGEAYACRLRLPTEPPRLEGTILIESERGL